MILISVRAVDQVHEVWLPEDSPPLYVAQILRDVASTVARKIEAA